MWSDVSSGAKNETNAGHLLGGETSMWSNQYFPGRKGLAPCLLPSPSRDRDFSRGSTARGRQPGGCATGAPEREQEFYCCVMRKKRNTITTAFGLFLIGEHGPRETGRVMRLRCKQLS